MLPANFNIVLTGENLPVQSILVSDFKFDRRTLRETVRFPLGLQAETQGASLHVLPERIQAAVTEVRNITTDADNLVDMMQTIFCYIGPKSFAGVGHNAQFFLDPAIPKSAVAEAALNVPTITDLIDGDPLTADVTLFRRIPNGAILRTSLLTQTPIDQVVIEFNAHFEVKAANAFETITLLQDSLRIMSDIAARAQESLQRQKVAL
jgi:hypothetical protein